MAATGGGTAASIGGAEIVTADGAIGLVMPRAWATKGGIPAGVLAVTIGGGAVKLGPILAGATGGGPGRKGLTGPIRLGGGMDMG